jgi:uncharacterized protein (TIGR01244 family)
MTAISLSAPGCKEQKKDTMKFGIPRRVTDWDGVNHVFRDGRVYFAGQPTESGLREAADREIAVVVNIRPESEMKSKVDFDEPAVVGEIGIDYVTIPVTPDTLSRSQVRRLHEVLTENEGNMLIHCGSSNRVGGLWALYLHQYESLPLDQALERGRQAGMTSESVENAVKRVAGE